MPVGQTFAASLFLSATQARENFVCSKSLTFLLSLFFSYTPTHSAKAILNKGELKCKGNADS
jgi:hypothetical protein